jgi:hypothetical protein
MIALIVMVILVLIEMVLSLFFIFAILTGRGNNFLLGTIMGAEFLVLAAAMICYICTHLPHREVVEDREKGLLW